MFSISDALAQAGTNIGALKATLNKGREALVKLKAEFPDLAAEIDPQIAEIDAKLAELDAPLSPQALLELGVALLPEIRNILQFKLDPKPHAGSGI